MSPKTQNLKKITEYLRFQYAFILIFQEGFCRTWLIWYYTCSKDTVLGRILRYWMLNSSIIIMNCYVRMFSHSSTFKNLKNKPFKNKLHSLKLKETSVLSIWGCYVKLRPLLLYLGLSETFTPLKLCQKCQGLFEIEKQS